MMSWQGNCLTMFSQQLLIPLTPAAVFRIKVRIRFSGMGLISLRRVRLLIPWHLQHRLAAVATYTKVNRLS